MRELLSNRMKLLNEDLYLMASLVEKQIFNSVVVLKKQDIKLAQEVINNDDKIDDLQRKIEKKCIKFMATESPLARDLRKIYTTSKIVTDLERIADYAVDICKIAKRIEGQNIIQEIEPVWEMVDVAIEMIKGSVEAFIDGDIDKAYEVCALDDKIDELYRGMFKSILKSMAKDENIINQGTQILFASKYIERVGDHVTNICEWVIFSANGSYVDLNE